MQSQKPSRPVGITLIGILDILSGIGILLLGVAVAAFSALLSTSTLFGSASGAILGLGAIIGGVIAIFGLIYLVVGFGFLNGKGWAWSLAMFFNFLAIIVSIALTALGSYTSIVGVVFYGFLIWYFTRSRVKAFFGKGGSLPTMTTSPYAPSSFSTPSQSSYFPQPTTNTSGSMPTLSVAPSQPTVTSTSATPRFCTNCGATLATGATKCASCGRTF
jgi:ribosomal protein L40E